MLVEADSGEFLTQRELPRMALIHPKIEADRLSVEAPGMSRLEVPLVKSGPPQRVKVWTDECESIDQGTETANWFSEYLGLDCRLVRMSAAFTRTLNPRYALSPQDQVHFADGFPFLLISEESLADLNGRMDEPLPMNRFRPNIVISGSGLPFCEDEVKQVRMGEIAFSIVKPCARCKITTTDQITAQTAKEPLRTLATYRKAQNGGVMFGQNVIHQGQGVLRVGDGLKVLELKEDAVRGVQ